ncbi:putative transporter [Sporosarcina sp. NCCP-2716]|uniref:aspartate:alanine exchanger family transporter n=1 Tax=Sporosarcina sp. NCCP-2716 TaxID=2943679 RepID=UPI00203D2226|nr:TrkA C-terminal domain-containing protein [Sporosarcina sp. NCCP-2716]GKV70152.1 putative transporter [Sporosarcina sp. NCCP-2716]
MDLLHSLLSEPLILLFVILFLGSWFGSLSVKGLNLGAAGVLLVAMVFGHFGFAVSPVIQNFGLSLFIVGIGLQAGPRFFRMLRTSGLVFGILSLLIIVFAVVTTVVVAKWFNLAPALSVGLMTGALTSTPGLAAALQATHDPLASVGYGIAYPFGVLAVVLFVQLLPRLGKIDLQKDLESTVNPIRTEGSPVVITLEVTNPMLHKSSLSELNFAPYDAVVSRVIRDGHTMIALGDTILLEGDHLVIVGNETKLHGLTAYVGRRVETDLENPDNVHLRKVTVDADEVTGKTLKELRLRKDHGTTVTRITREGIELPQNPNLPLIRGDVLTIVSTEQRLDEVEALFTRKKLAVTNLDIFSISITLLLGVLLGMVPIPIPGLGTIELGTAGGPLFVALIIGHFGKIGPIHVRYYGPSNHVIRELGLVLFLAGAGTTAGAGIVEVIQTEGVKLVFGGVLITLVPIFAGYFAARKLLKLSVVHSLGGLSGGMTSTPALGALNQLIDSEDPAIAYAAAYPFALILVAVASQLIVFFL